MNLVLMRWESVSTHTDRRIQSFGRGCRVAGLLCTAVLWAALAAMPPAHAWQEVPLCASIGWNLISADGPWYTDPPPAISADQIIYFHALDPAGNPKTSCNDPDLVNGQMVNDIANYDWDYCYQTDVDTHGLAQYIAYTTPGDRTVRLDVDDDDGAGKTNDAPKWDSTVVAVTLTVETDWMAGYGLVSMDAFPGRWSGAGYSSVVIDEQHNGNCTYHEYLYDYFAGDTTQLTAYLDGYENQSCDLYLIGIDKWSTDPAKASWRGLTWNSTYCCIFRGLGAALGAELHECACHDPGVGAIGHCTSKDPGTDLPLPCACKAAASNDAFCAVCKQSLRNYVISHSP